jgi:signal transduction histidine kinase
MATMRARSWAGVRFWLTVRLRPWVGAPLRARAATRLRARVVGWLPRRTVRLRLTLLYATLFLVSGAALLTITYLLLTHKLFGAPATLSVHGGPVGPGPPPGLAGVTQTVGGGTGTPPPLRQVLYLSSLTLGGMLAVSIVAGWLMAGRVLRPLRTMTIATRQISETSLHRRLAVTGPGDELKDLADTIDGLLGRLDAAFDAQRDALAAQRQFVANASHELRGPLTLERAALEIALADPDAGAPALRSTCERVLAASKQQERLIDALLVLARGQRGLDRSEPVDLAAVADEVLLARHAEICRRGLQVWTGLHPAAVLGDTRLVERLIVNLVDNAIRHNLPGGRVEIATGTGTGRAMLAVTNTGPAVPPAEVDRLLRPFQRLGADRIDHNDGHGLGLSIVAAIAAAHAAELRVHPRPTGGLTVEVHFAPR